MSTYTTYRGYPLETAAAMIGRTLLMVRRALDGRQECAHILGELELIPQCPPALQKVAARKIKERDVLDADTQAVIDKANRLFRKAVERDGVDGPTYMLRYLAFIHYLGQNNDQNCTMRARCYNDPGGFEFTMNQWYGFNSIYRRFS